jgi:hypothetical protein
MRKGVDDYVRGVIAQRRALPQEQWPDGLLLRPESLHEVSQRQ